MSKINEAIAYACKVHANQYRKLGNTPFIFHATDVGSIVASMSKDEDVICAAILHDTVEDTSTTLDDIEEMFGKKVRDLVDLETEDKREGQSKASTWRVRKEESLEEIRNSDSLDGRKIWLADKLCNLRSYYSAYLRVGNDLWDNFNEKDPLNHEWYYREIAEIVSPLKEYAAYKEYMEILERLFGEYHEL